MLKRYSFRFVSFAIPMSHGNRAVECPANPYFIEQRFSIFHAKEIEDAPTLFNMQDRLSAVKNGDIFYLALADWEGPAK